MDNCPPERRGGKDARLTGKCILSFPPQTSTEAWGSQHWYRKGGNRVINFKKTN